VLVDAQTDVGAAISDLAALLARAHGVNHVTLQVAPDRGGQPLQVEPALPALDAVQRAAQLVQRARPTMDVRTITDELWSSVRAAPDARYSPVRLASSYLRAHA
jgi:hypothetical protein